MQGLVSIEGSEAKVEPERGKCLAGGPIAIESALCCCTPHEDITLGVPPFVLPRVPCESWDAEPKSSQIALVRIEGKWAEGI